MAREARLLGGLKFRLEKACSIVDLRRLHVALSYSLNKL